MDHHVSKRKPNAINVHFSKASRNNAVSFYLIGDFGHVKAVITQMFSWVQNCLPSLENCLLP